MIRIFYNLPEMRYTFEGVEDKEVSEFVRGGVSILLNMLLNQCECGKLTYRPTIVRDGDSIEMRLNPREKYEERARELLETVYIGVCLLTIRYPEEVNVKGEKGYARNE